MISSLAVPVVDVHNENFKELWPAMVVALKTSSFIALDTELSGLGNRKALLADSIEDRYKAICHAARSRSILSLGFACYKKTDNQAADTYLAQVYNLTLQCSEEYIIEPQSVQFLVQHGFDFNKQYAHGIPYLKGNNKGGSDNQGVHFRALFTELLRARKPLVLHNGLIDLAFLYQCFYAHLPDRLGTFTNDLSEMFPAGIYDTKYVTEFELRLTASYLEYAYKKCKLDNSRGLTTGEAGPHVQVEFCQYVGHMSSYVDFRECPAVASTEGQTEVCQRFSAFGWCANGTQCPLSHDTDLIILQDEKSKDDKRKKRKRQRNKKKGGDVVEDSSVLEGAPEKKMPHMDIVDTVVEEKPLDESNVTQPNSDTNDQNTSTATPLPATNITSTTTDTDIGVENIIEDDMKKSSDCVAQEKNPDTGTHRAGFDAFMTGFIFAHASARNRKNEEGEAGNENEQLEADQWLPSCLNKVYLSGKEGPLIIVKSTFSKSSKAHVKKMEMLWGSKIQGL